MLLAMMIACSEVAPPAIPPAPAEPDMVEVAQGGPAGEGHAPTYDAELAWVDLRLAHFAARAEARPEDLGATRAVELLIERAHLTGDPADHDRAQRLLDAAFAASPAGGGPHDAAASLATTLHRYDPALDHLQHVRGGDALRAAIALDRGEYDAARQALEALAETGDPAHLSRLAIVRWKTGDIEGAHAALDQAEARYHGAAHRPRAWVHLQRGLIDLEHARLDDAMAHYRDAERAMAGYWLIDEHIAEVHLRRGQLADAERMYRDLVDRTENPELMDQLAETLDALGREDEARVMVRRAREAYDRRLARYPEATWGHALGHWETYGDPAEHVAMAEANFRNRPNGEAAIGLIRALHRVGRIDDARAQLVALQGTAFRSPEVALVEALLRSEP